MRGLKHPRCTGPAADHCRICSYLPEDNEPEPKWGIRQPLTSGTVYLVSRARDPGTHTWVDDDRSAEAMRFDCASHAHQFIREFLGSVPAEVFRIV